MKIPKRFHSSSLAGIGLLLVFMFSVCDKSQGDDNQPEWDDRFNVHDAQGFVSTMTVQDSNLYVAGALDAIDGVLVKHIAKWDGANWSALAEGLNQPVNALAAGVDGLYVGGSFTQAGRVAVGGIAKWDGTRWSAVGNGVGIGGLPNMMVKSIAVDGNTVYIAGNFTSVDGVEAPYVAKWDGQQWSAVGHAQDITTNGVVSLAFSGGTLYGAGGFYSTDHQRMAYLARLEGGEWVPLDDGVDNAVRSLAAKGNTLYVLGDFGSAGGLTANGFAMWDGMLWSVAPALVSSGYRVSAISVAGDQVFLADLRQPNPFTIDSSRISQLDGTNTSTVVETGGGVWTLARYGNDLVCYGGFQINGGVRTGNLAKWDGTKWSPVGTGNLQGVNGYVSILAANGTNVYAAGSFTHAAESAVNYFAKWDGSHWSTLDGGFNGGVSAMAVQGNDLYVVGGFTLAGGVAATNIARWNGSNWSAVGGGLEGALSAIAVSSASNVYVARFLTVPNEGSRTEVVHWNGTNWTVIAAGFGYPGNYGYVRSMALIRNDLFVAGKFTSFSQLTANNIARWDGTNWLALGSGLVGSEEWQPNSMTLTYVSTLAVHGNELFVGGSFTNAGGVPASNVAKWDGLKWSALGNGISGIGNVFTLGCSYFPVSSLAVSDAAVYVGGQFTDASGVTANRIAKWDGSTWSALRGGVAGLISQVWQYALPAVARCELPDVLALAFANNSLFVETLPPLEANRVSALEFGMNRSCRSCI